MTHKLYSIVRKNTLLRKSFSIIEQIPKVFKAYFDNDLTVPPVIANSIPKSGTHLLTQILEGLPTLKSYHAFIASKPTVRFEERSDQAVYRRMNLIVGSELLATHLYYKEDYFKRLINKNSILYFIYRDPRDIAISEAMYLTYMNKYHRAHKYFSKKLTNDFERIMYSIKGIPYTDVSFDFPNITERVSPYLGWLEKEEVLAVKFEDLTGEHRNQTLREIIKHYKKYSTVDFNEVVVLKAVTQNINPKKSHTYRTGKSGNWTSVLTNEHKEAMKEYAGDLLINLGYEADYNW